MKDFHFKFDQALFQHDYAHDGNQKIFFSRFLQPDTPSNFAWVDYVEVPPGADIGLHRHGAEEEIYVVLSGRAHMQQCGEKIEINAGDVIRNPPFGKHGLINDFNDSLRLVVVTAFPPSDNWILAGVNPTRKGAQ